MLRGYVALWEKKWPEAEQNFEKVILDNAPTTSSPRTTLPWPLSSRRTRPRSERALDYAEGNYSDNNKNPDALSTLGWVYFRRGEFDQAGLALDQAIKATGGNLNNPDTATYVAHILHHRQQDWEAKKILEAILWRRAGPSR